MTIGGYAGSRATPGDCAYAICGHGANRRPSVAAGDVLAATTESTFALATLPRAATVGFNPDASPSTNSGPRCDSTRTSTLTGRGTSRRKCRNGYRRRPTPQRPGLSRTRWPMSVRAKPSGPCSDLGEQHGRPSGLGVYVHVQYSAAEHIAAIPSLVASTQRPRRSYVPACVRRSQTGDGSLRTTT